MSKSYHPCRWYDQYPTLAFALDLIRWLPHPQQAGMGLLFKQYLDERLEVPQESPPLQTGHRWYDHLHGWAALLERLKQAPHGVKLQSTTFLLHGIQKRTGHPPPYLASYPLKNA